MSTQPSPEQIAKDLAARDEKIRARAYEIVAAASNRPLKQGQKRQVPSLASALAMATEEIDHPPKPKPANVVALPASDKK